MKTEPSVLYAVRGALYAAVVGNSIRPNRSLASEVWVPFSRGFIEESFAGADLSPRHTKIVVFAKSPFLFAILYIRMSSNTL